MNSRGERIFSPECRWLVLYNSIAERPRTEERELLYLWHP